MHPNPHFFALERPPRGALLPTPLSFPLAGTSPAPSGVLFSKAGFCGVSPFRTENVICGAGICGGSGEVCDADHAIIAGAGGGTGEALPHDPNPK